MSTASGNALFYLGVKDKYWRRKTPHTILKHTVTLVLAADPRCACTQLSHAGCFHHVWPVAASFISLIPLFKRYDVWRSTDQYQSLAYGDDCITTLLETTGARASREREVKKEKGCERAKNINNIRGCDEKKQEREHKKVIFPRVLSQKDSFTAVQALSKTAPSVYESLTEKCKNKCVEWAHGEWVGCHPAGTTAFQL